MCQCCCVTTWSVVIPNYFLKERTGPHVKSQVVRAGDQSCRFHNEPPINAKLLIPITDFNCNNIWCHCHFGVFTPLLFWQTHAVLQCVVLTSSLCLPLSPHSNDQSSSLWAPPCVGSPTGSASSWPSSCTAVLQRSPGVLLAAWTSSSRPPAPT